MAKIPTKKHTKEELGELKARSAMEVNPMAPGSAARDYARQVAHPIFIAIVYLSSIATPIFFLLAEFIDGKQPFQSTSIYAMAVITGLALLLVILLFFRKKLSRHHSAFALLFVLASIGIIVWLTSKDPILADKFGL